MDMEEEGSPTVQSLLESVIAYNSQKLLPVVVCRFWNQNNRARGVTESEKHGIHMPKILLVVIQGLWTCILSFICWNGPTVISDCSQVNMVFCASGMAQWHLLFLKTKSDMMICGQLIDCLSLCLHVCCHRVVTWSSFDHLDQSEPSWLYAAIPICKCPAHPCWLQRLEDVDASRYEYRSLRY